MALLEMNGITKSFGGVRALQGVDLTLESGRVHAIVGENGAGKSTLIKIIMGVLRPDRGSIRVEGNEVVIASPLVARRLGFSAVYQEPLIYPYLTVLENIFMSQPLLNRVGNLDQPAMVERIEPILHRLGLDRSILRLEMRQLQLGYQQLVLIAQALLNEARLILFDEPTSILSGNETDHLFEIIADLRRSNKAVVYISHRLEELLSIADEATVLTDGVVVGYMGQGGLDLDRMLELMAGKATRRFEKQSEAPYQKIVDRQAEPRLDVQHLTVSSYFRNVSFKLWPGEVLGFYGQVGAGRSELGLTLFGHLRPDSGQVFLNGREVSFPSPRHAIQQGVGYLPEDRKAQGIFAHQTIRINLASVVVRKLLRVFGYIDSRQVTDLVIQYTNSLNIKMGNMFQAITSLSGGGQQKVVLARWMAENLQVLILDEPTRGIDIITKREIHRLINELASQGLAVIVVSSDLPEVIAVSHRIIVMNRGTVAATFDEVKPTIAEDVLKAAIGLQSQGTVVI